jgi:hypothetical protein
VWQIARSTIYKGSWVADKKKEMVVSVPPIVDVDT